jgi:hypothetical protein
VIPEATVISTMELCDALDGHAQTIEGTLVAYNSEPDTSMCRWDYSHFPQSSARLCIVAVDSAFFEVYTKDHAHVQMLKARFRDAREESPAQWFLD